MGDPLEEYLAIYDDAAGHMFVALDAAIRQASPELDVAIRVPPRACEWRGAGGSSYRSAFSAPARPRR